MTRKDYKLIAEYLGMERKWITSKTELRGFDKAVNCIANAFHADNSRFSHQKFLEAINKHEL